MKFWVCLGWSSFLVLILLSAGSCGGKKGCFWKHFMRRVGDSTRFFTYKIWKANGYSHSQICWFVSTTYINQLHTTIFQRGACWKSFCGILCFGTSPSHHPFFTCRTNDASSKKNQPQAPSNMHTTTEGDVKISSAYRFCGKSWHQGTFRNVFESTTSIQILYCPTCFPFITGASTRWIILTQPSFLIVFGQQKRPPPTSLSRFKTKVMARFTFFLRAAIWAMNKQKNTCWRFCGLKRKSCYSFRLLSQNHPYFSMWIMSTSPPRDMFYEYSDLGRVVPIGFLEYEPLIYQPTHQPTNPPTNQPQLT